MRLLLLAASFAVLVPSARLSMADEPQKTPKQNAAADTTVADHALKEQLRTILADRAQNSQRGVRQAEVEALTTFTNQHANTKAALRAQFLVGNAYLNEGRPDEVAKGKPYFDALVQEHPHTVEAALARVQLALLALRSTKDPALRRQQVVAVQAAIGDALPYTRQLDEDKSELVALFKERTIGSPKDQFTPRLKLDLAGLQQMDGDPAEAKVTLKGIIEEYPASIWSEKATRRLKSIEREEQEAARTGGR
jgi:TolA-binding protein